MSTLTPSFTRRRARLAGLTRHRGEDHPDVEQARRDLDAERVTDDARRLVAGWPALTEQQKAELRALLAPAIGAK